MNKNTKQRQSKIRREIIRQHREHGGLPPSKDGGKLISKATEKNAIMVVYHNESESGEVTSITRFLPAERDKKQYRREFKATHDHVLGRDQ